jgi:hypothetical protein
MSMPGFSAEASLSQHSDFYPVTLASAQASGSASVIPSQLFGGSPEAILTETRSRAHYLPRCLLWGCESWSIPNGRGGYTEYEYCGCLYPRY